jgi:hypothetical protein
MGQNCNFGVKKLKRNGRVPSGQGLGYIPEGERHLGWSRSFPSAF